MPMNRPSTRMLADTIVGYVLVAGGLIMLLTPGPGLIAIVAGLAVLARHYRWADRIRHATLARIRDTTTWSRAQDVSHRVVRCGELDHDHAACEDGSSCPSSPEAA
jgi:hypothetical protein